MTDVKSLETILEAIKDDFKDKSMPTIIFDRGMVSEKNLTLLKEKADDNRISYPAIKRKLAEFEKKNLSQYPFIQINLKEPSLTWNTIDELANQERSLDGNYLLKTNRLDLDQQSIFYF